jgi:glutamyl-tRNA reductase
LNFVAQIRKALVNEIRIIAISHKNFPLETIGKFHIAPEQREIILSDIKSSSGIDEIMYLSTCNRVEFIFTLPHFVCPGFTKSFLKKINSGLSDDELNHISNQAERFNGEESIEHLLKVSSSLESVVIGEREIITQMRNAFEEAQKHKLSGDKIRMIISQCIKTAKEIFSHTDLARKPVSVVSLAWQEFRNFGHNKDVRIVLVGAGQIIRNFLKFLSENGYHNFTIVNRTETNAQTLADAFGGKSLALDQLHKYYAGFDALITCTASDQAVINPEIYSDLLHGDAARKQVIDLSLPADINADILKNFNVSYVGMNTIQEMASVNILFREQALVECLPYISKGIDDFEKALQERRIEQAMQSIPEAIKEIKSTALGSVFAKDLENLDEEARDLLNKIVSYMEKKYISVPMKMAREVLLSETRKN